MIKTGFHHIGLKYSNLEKSINFYTNLGLTELCRWGKVGEEIVMMSMTDGGIIELLPTCGEQFEANGKWIHFAVKVDDVDKAYQNALSLGATPLTEPKVVALDAKPSPMSINIAFVKGPDGEELEFFKII